MQLLLRVSLLVVDWVINALAWGSNFVSMLLGDVLDLRIERLLVPLVVRILVRFLLLMEIWARWSSTVALLECKAWELLGRFFRLHKLHAHCLHRLRDLRDLDDRGDHL